MKKETMRVYMIFYIVLLIGPLVSLTSCDLIFDRKLPTDAELEQRFRDNRHIFEKNVQMSDEDSIVNRISYKFTDVWGKGLSTDTGDLGFSEERWNEYKSLFRKLKLDSGIIRWENGAVRFSAFSKGLAVSGISKGYIYSKQKNPWGEVECTNETLDVPAPAYDKPFICKNLDKNWYLYVSR